MLAAIAKLREGGEIVIQVLPGSGDGKSCTMDLVRATPADLLGEREFAFTDSRLPEMLFRYLELEVPGAGRVLLPMNFARVQRRAVRVKSILGHQFAKVPATKLAEQVTLLEEEKIMAYYGAGTLYATPQRQEPLL